MRHQAIYPEAAVAWMIPQPPKTVLDVGSGRGQFAEMIADAGHHLVCVDSNPHQAARLAVRVPKAHVCVAQAEALPFRSRSFEVVTVHESLTRFAPGLALAEFARVLRPGGHLAIVFNSRDDTVPWVRRLARRIQVDDPTAMRGDYGSENLEALEGSPYFPHFESRSFRNWIPIDRAGMAALVRNRPALARLPQDRLSALLHDVDVTYEQAARPPEPLLLPFQADCRVSVVDHAELSLPVTEESLRISMRF